MPTLMVVGSGGRLGSTLVPYLRAGGHHVVTAARTRADVMVDLTDQRQVTATLDQVAPDIIVHLVALTDVDQCERQPHLAYLSNVRTVETISTWMTARGVSPHLIYVSTDQVYDGAGAHVETDITLTNYYAFSKYAGELAAATVSSTILRTNFFGRSHAPGRPSLSDWLVGALRQGAPINVFDDVRFSPLSLRRLATLIERVATSRKRGCFNLGSTDGLSKADFAFELAAALQLPTHGLTRTSVDHARLGAYRPRGMCMDSSQFERTFGVVLPTLKEEIHLAGQDYLDDSR